jgi:hypothetical protein
MKHSMLMVAIALIICLPAVAGAVTFVEDFEGGSNVGQWTFGNGADTIEPEGGNPGYWFHNPSLDTFAPNFRCGYYGAEFTGNYVDMGVTTISGDFRTDYASNGTAWYPFALLLRNTYGTPNDPEDDVYVYWVNENDVWCPQVGEGWTHYDFTIPSDFVGAPGELPAEWMGGSYWTGLDIFPEDKTWQEVISSVDRIEFWWFHPAWYGIFAQWDVGADNVTIESMLPVATEESSWSSLKSLY